ncbi:hypothetical protein ABEB36_009896 [Hypothenemus hampei]|uniref:Amino acid transporter transmembrane domain-containing protein n=1 Tax=Hypothenemus hampei TaxID=57062 RepID=A0ABD1EIH0_HYPHA
MQPTEISPLLTRNIFNNNGLSVFFAIICIVDVFGVFPVVALPKPIIDCGYYGIAVVAVVCFIQVYTAILLGKCWNLAEEINPNILRKNRYPYSALAELTFGKYICYYVTFLVDVTVFSGGIPNLILAAQNLELLGLRISNNAFHISLCYWIIILGTLLCPVLWLGSPKDMKVLCTVSVLIVASVYLLTCGCLIFTNGTPVPPEINFDSNLDLWKLLMIAYGIVAFQFDIHPTILTIQMDMKNKRKLPNVILGGFLVSLFMFSSTTIITATKYGSTAKSSLLETLPTSIPLHFAALLVAIQLCLTSAVSNSALYQHLEDCLNISREFNRKRCILRTILTILAIVIAESVPRFDLVMSLIGGTLIGPLVFILPPLFYIRMLYLRGRHVQKLKSESFTNIVMSGKESNESDRDLAKYYEAKFNEEMNLTTNFKCNQTFETALCVVIIVCSSVATLATTYLNISNAALSYSNFTKPCIYNVSNALLYL